MHVDEARSLLAEERARLERARTAMHATGLGLDDQRGDLGELSGMDEHIADVATETFEREVGFGVLHELEGALREVVLAAERLDGGRFGRCRMCGVAIPDERLRAVPATELCVAHQADAELADAALRHAAAHRDVAIEAAAHLDLLPAEDRGPSAPGAEEAAVHVVQG